MPQPTGTAKELKAGEATDQGTRYLPVSEMVVVVAFFGDESVESYATLEMAAFQGTIAPEAGL